MKFSPCTGKCTDEGTHCDGCGRAHGEIAELKTHLTGLLDFAKKMDYENIDEFADSVAGTIKYKMKAG